jgi:N-acetylglutamate synthase-like GNAT family acetyltransferase
MPQELVKHGFVLTTDKAKLQIDVICGFLARSYWGSGRRREAIIRSIENSLCYGIFHDGRQVAFARLVTDLATFAYLCDVFVDEAYRGRGLSKWMMADIMENPDFSDLRRFFLVTKDAHSLYEKFGFKPLTDEEQLGFMSIFKEGM